MICRQSLSDGCGQMSDELSRLVSIDAVRGERGNVIRKSN